MAETALKLTEGEEGLLRLLPDGDLSAFVRQSGLPNRRVEEWKWSDLRRAMPEAREASAAYSGQADLSGIWQGMSQIILGNGRFLSEHDLPDGVMVKTGENTPFLMAQAPVASLATAGAKLSVSINKSSDQPFVIRRLSEGQGQHADFVQITVEEGVQATLIESHELSDAPFANSLTMIHLKKGATLHRLVVQHESGDAILVHTTMPALEEGATLNQTSLCHGARFARHETQAALMGQATLQLDAAYELQGETHNDFTSHVHLMTPGSKVSQLTKGIVEDQSTSVFQGKFLVDRAAQQTSARMGHHSLILSDQATVNAKPELEIYADDVECAHGNTSGALDDEAIFYLRQRGLDQAQAQRLLTEAFIGEVTDRIASDDLAIFTQKWMETT